MEVEDESPSSSTGSAGGLWRRSVKLEKDKKAMLEKPHNAIILSLGDKVLIQVFKEKTIVGVWAKFDRLYMTKSLVNVSILNNESRKTYSRIVRYV